jgi:hypothetical protein
MPNTIMTIKLINPPGSTGRGSIVGTDDQRLGVFPEKIGIFEVGKTYDVEYVETDRNGKTLRNVKSAKQITASSPTASPAAAAPASPGANGHGNGTGGYYRQTDPVDSERMFVCAALTAFIKAGKIEPELGKVTNAITVLRTAYQKTFGFDDRIFTASEAGQQRPRLVAAE